MNPSSPDLFEPVERDTLLDPTTLERLTLLCAQELTAAQTYQQVLTIADLSRHVGVLSRCYASHRSRAVALTERVAAFEGVVPRSSGVWGPMKSLLSTPVPIASERLVIDLLDQAESAWLQNYQDELHRLSASDREFLSNRILPAQQTTREAVKDLKSLLRPHSG
jgi:hypothetical protein